MRLLSIISAALIAATPIATPLAAQERETLGFGRIFTNDYFGDNEDRWRSGSYSYSIVRGPEWQGEAPTRPGALLEYRLRSEIISPGALNGPGSTDRAYVGALSAGLHTHFTYGRAQVSAGLDLVATGPQTGVSDLQDWFHDLISIPGPSSAVAANQVGNAFYPTVLTEASYRFDMNGRTSIRPFIEAQFGVEDFARVGVDILVGPMLQNDLWLRDSVSGQLYSGVESGRAGTGFVFGADYAVVSDSAYFPASFGTQAEDGRFRVRAGGHWRLGDGLSYFYGLTYLSEEYVGQDGGQVVGSLKLNFNF